MGCECSSPRQQRVETEESLGFLTEPRQKHASKSLPTSPTNLKSLPRPITAFYRVVAFKQSQHGNKVALAEYMNTKQLCILKTFPKPGPLLVERARVKFSEECTLLRQLDHPHIVRWFEVLEDTKNFYIVTEALTGDDIREFLQRMTVTTESFAAKLISQILSALVYCHKLGVAHKGLKICNVMMVEMASEELLQVKITGFENSCSFSSTKHLVSDPSCFVAPEAYFGRGEPKSDIWSCGAILYQMISGEEPIDKDSYSSVLTMSKYWTVKLRGELWCRVSEEMRSLISAMLSYTPSCRPSAWQCLIHPWLIARAPAAPLDSVVVRQALHNLTTIQSTSSLKEAIKRYLLYRVAKLTEIYGSTEAFKAIDRTGEGIITRFKLANALKERGEGGATELEVEKEAERVMGLLDRNADGSITFSEFIVSACSERRLLSQENVLSAFMSLDRDKRGKIYIESMKNMFYMTPGGEKERLWNDLLRILRRPEHEDIDFQEFRELIIKSMQ